MFSSGCLDYCHVKMLLKNHSTVDCCSLGRLRDRVTVKTGPRHVVRETEDGAFQMTIKSALRSDAGIYTCKIINEYGAKQCEGKLQVKGEVPPQSGGFLLTHVTSLIE